MEAVHEQDVEVISIEHARTGTAFYFLASQKKGLRFAGALPHSPTEKQTAFSFQDQMAAEKVAEDFAREHGWL